jgi:hypothetical protein
MTLLTQTGRAQRFRLSARQSRGPGRPWLSSPARVTWSGVLGSCNPCQGSASRMPTVGPHPLLRLPHVYLQPRQPGLSSTLPAKGPYLGTGALMLQLLVPTGSQVCFLTQQAPPWPERPGSYPSRSKPYPSPSWPSLTSSKTLSQTAKRCAPLPCSPTLLPDSCVVSETALPPVGWVGPASHEGGGMGCKFPQKY